MNSLVHGFEDIALVAQAFIGEAQAKRFRLQKLVEGLRLSDVTALH